MSYFLCPSQPCPYLLFSSFKQLLSIIFIVNYYARTLSPKKLKEMKQKGEVIVRIEPTTFNDLPQTLSLS